MILKNAGLGKFFPQTYPFWQIEFQYLYCCVANFGFRNNLAVLYLKMVFPLFFSRVKKSDNVFILFIFECTNIASFILITMRAAIGQVLQEG